MKQRIALHDLVPGQWAQVDALLAEGPMRRRLLDLGLVKGSRVCCLHYSPAGDPIAYNIRGAVISLRLEDSSQILVSLQA
jgi:ferrous iron transport protein A